MAGSKDSSDSMALRADGEDTPIFTKVGHREQIVIGRGIECDVVVKDVKASRRHCKLSRQGDQFLLEDLGSKNGTYVDGKRITAQTTMKPQQSFKIGDTIFYLSN